MFPTRQTTGRFLLALSLWTASSCSLDASSVITEPELKGVSIALNVDGFDIQTVEFQINGPALADTGAISGIFFLTGEDNATIWEQITDLPAGTDYHLILIARGPLGRILCQSEAFFDIVPDEITKVDIVLVCGEDNTEATGSVEIDGTVEVVDAGVCGDGVRSTKEQCDDGNNRDGDGCSALCDIEFVCEALTLRCSSKTSGLPREGTGTLTVLPDAVMISDSTAEMTIVMDDVVFNGFEPGEPVTLGRTATTVRIHAGPTRELELLRLVPVDAVPHMNWFAFGTSGIERFSVDIPSHVGEFVAEISALEAEITVGETSGTLYCTSEGTIRIPVFAADAF